MTVTEVGGVATVTITGTVNPPQASHSNFIALTADNLAATVDTAAAICIGRLKSDRYAADIHRQ